MGNLTSTLTLALQEDITKRAPATARALDGLGKAGQDLAGKLGKFKDLTRDTAGLGTAFRAARQDVARLTADLDKARARAEALKGTKGKSEERDGAAADVRRLARDLDGAKASAAQAGAAWREQATSLRSLRNELLATGVQLGQMDKLGRRGLNLRAAEEGLAQAAAAANAQLERQAALMANAVAKAEGLARANRDLTRGMTSSSAITGDGRRLAEGMSQPGRIARAERAARLREEAEAAAEARARRREAAATLGAGTAVLAGHKSREIAKGAITSAAEFDIAVRKQKAFTDISHGDQAGLLAQAKRIGQETQFSNIDVVKAQTASMQGLPAGFSPALKAAVAEGIVQNVRNYATLMDTDLKEGAETIRSYLQATGKDISTKEKALFEANKAVNQIVKMAKLGGMSGEDAAQYVKYAAASATSAGLSTDSLLSLGALARRGGLRGDEAGVFMRATANKLVSPTKKGLAAYNAAGIDHSKFVRMPDQLSTSALEGQFRLEMGKGFTAAIRKRLDAINADKTLLADQSRYVAAVTSAVEPILGKKSDGQVRASDLQVAAKAAGNYYKVGAQSVDVEKLLDALMSANPTLAQLNAILTDKHGGKGAITQRQWDDFKADRAALGKAANDPDWAKRQADEVWAGLGGAVENLKGSFENLVLTIGNANSGLIKATADMTGKGLDSFSTLPEAAQQGLSLGAIAGSTLASLWGSVKLLKLVTGIGGTAAGATSAGAVGGAAGGTAALTNGAAGVAGAGAAAAGAVAAGVAVGGIAATVAANEAIKNRDFADPYLDGGMLGADPGGYGLGAAIMHAPDLARRMSEQNQRAQAPSDTRRFRASFGLEGGQASAVARVMPGSDGASGPGFGAGAKVMPGSDASGLEPLVQKSDEVKAKLEEVSGVTVKPSGDTSALDAIIQKAGEALSALMRLSSAAGDANAQIGRVNTASAAGRVRQTLSNNHTA